MVVFVSGCVVQWMVWKLDTQVYDNGFDAYISAYSPSFICEGGLTGLATSQLSDR